MQSGLRIFPRIISLLCSGLLYDEPADHTGQGELCLPRPDTECQEGAGATLSFSLTHRQSIFCLGSQGGFRIRMRIRYDPDSCSN